MAKNDKGVYAPGELDRVRKNLKVTDRVEAQRMSQKLGGEVGYERSPEFDPIENSRYGRINAKSGGKPKTPKRRLELADDIVEDEKNSTIRNVNLDPSDDPAIPLKYSYLERLRMDRCAAQGEFEIKSPGQVFQTMLSFFGEPPDFVNPYFITKRMQEYYQKIESLVLATRSLFPRNNLRRNERMKKNAPMAYAILDTLRYWNIEKISGDLARHQSRPRSVRVKDFSDILRAVYKPLFILDLLDMEAHIRTAFKILYKALSIESPREAQKFQPVIRTALSSYADVRREIRYLLYPLLLKLVSSTWLPYEVFFMARKNRLMAFLNVSEGEQLNPAQIAEQLSQKDESGEDSDDSGEDSDGSGKTAEKAQTEKVEVKEEEISDEEKAQRAVVQSEQKALERGIQALEMLFPKAGWEKLSEYPDLYPYFVNVLDLKRGAVNIAPTDPLQQVFVLMRILEELLIGLRSVSFNSIHGPNGSPERIAEDLMEIVNNWHYYIQQGFEKDYLPGLVEYVRIYEGSPEERSSQYAKKILQDLHWIKRLYFLPYYRFESVSAPSFQKKDAPTIYTEIKKLRRFLSGVAAGIEQGNRAGGAKGNARCDGIDNPWADYNFQVPNPLSKRLDALMAGKRKNNAALIYFSLAATVVLDYLVNDEKSWAYTPKSAVLFRSVDDKGTQPLTGVDKKIDADQLFMESLKNR